MSSIMSKSLHVFGYRSRVRAQHYFVQVKCEIGIQIHKNTLSFCLNLNGNRLRKENPYPWCVFRASFPKFEGGQFIV